MAGLAASSRVMYTQMPYGPPPSAEDRGLEAEALEENHDLYANGTAMGHVPSDDDDDTAESSGYSSGLKGPDTQWLPVCCTAACCCHFCYVFLFLSYLFIFPLWCKWLLTAPMPFGYWGQDYPDFPRMTLEQSQTAQRPNGGQPQIEISPIPSTPTACNYTCSKELHGFGTSEMNFEVNLRLNKADLAGATHSTYPVLLASEDFEHWMLVADRRNSKPTVFFEQVSGQSGRTYISVQDRCVKPSASSFALQKSYIIACVSWRPSTPEEQIDPSDPEALEEGWENDQLADRCQVLGGVCGWPCNSDIPPEQLPGCTKDGTIDQNMLDKWLPKRNASLGNVTLQACTSSTSPTCVTTTEEIGRWPCHRCVVRERPARRRLLPPMPGLPDMGDDEDIGDEGDEEDENQEQIYRSLPRFMVKYTGAHVPTSLDIMSSPRVNILAAHTLDGPWQRLYNPVDPESDFLPPTPTTVPEDTDPQTFKMSEDEVRAMTLQSSNMLTLSSESCFGKRGPLYLVACAVNQSLYDDGSQWKNSKEMRFQPGQKVMPPPFNDRCVAVAGRCGQACQAEGSAPPIPYCLANGYINQTMLVDEIPIQFNRKTPVFLFAYVLLLGFAVKTIMLCPGIFKPYRRCQYYDPEMTEQLRYILVVGVCGGADEGKGTMIRNTIGMVAGLPPECRCRFHVCNNEEGHRLEMLTCWEKFCAVLTNIPNQGGLSYEDNLRHFMQIWCDETKTMRLDSVGGKVKKLDPGIAARLSGKTTIAKIRKASNWEAFPPGALARLEAAIDQLHADLEDNYNKFAPMTPHLDYVKDWLPPDPDTTSLRMHFTSRAKPREDPRNIMVQHVAVGTWYYKVPPNATPKQWLELRKNCQEMIYSQPDDDDINMKVPLRSSHGKAGGLNFVDNYITIVNDRAENLYHSDQDDGPSLYAIADARHQFQPDFFISCVPCFFDVDGTLNKFVGFSQAPQHYPEYADKFDYLDNNNAQFFRLNAMIRNCCGGVSSCGTNGMWQVHPRNNSTIWQRRRKRVRDRDSRRRTELIEREQFHTSCKIEDTASSLDRVLVGEYSHFVNRKLSFGMSKSPEGFLGAQQRWVEGAITLCLQWVTQNADAHGQAKRNGPLLWAVIVAFALYVYSLLRLVTVQYTSSVLVEMGILSPKAFDSWIRTPLSPLINAAYDWLMDVRGGHSPNSYSYSVYEDMTLQFVVWLGTCVFAFFALWVFTTMCKCCRRWMTFPHEMKWWGRLVISFDNLTYWIWFWTSFFWIGFNFYLAIWPARFHFNNVAMMSFMLITTFLNYALIVSNSLRFSIMESMDANEIAFLSMDNIWRANQLFFMVGPIQGFSVFTGTKNFISYLLYGQDIGGWSGGDLTQISINIVKYWTTMIIFTAIFLWTYLTFSEPAPDEYQSRRPGCIIFTFIAMDVLHPCVYLWTVGNPLTSQEIAKMTWYAKLTSSQWWKYHLAGVILNEHVTNIFRYVNPAYMFMLPLLVFYNSYYAVNAGFALVAVGAGH